LSSAVGSHPAGPRIARAPVALVAYLAVGLGVAAQGLLDGAIDIVLRHILRARRDHRRPQPRVHGRIGHAELGGDCDLARELAEQLGFRRILPPLAVHDVLELGMAGHALLLDARPAPDHARSTKRRNRLIRSYRARAAQNPDCASPERGPRLLQPATEPHRADAAREP